MIQYLLHGSQPLSPHYVTGFTDGDGMFGFQVAGGSKVRGAEFKITAHASSRGVLLQLQRFFGCGRISIDNRRDIP